MTKEQFVMAMDAIEQQDKADLQFAENMQVCFPQACTTELRVESVFLLNALITLLQEQMNDTDENANKVGTWIDWWMYESEFGKTAKAYEKDGTRIPMATAGDLWEFLNKEKNETTKQKNK